MEVSNVLAPTPISPPQQTAQSRTFYKRDLPSPPAIAFSSAQGKELFTEALADGNMEGFFPLIEQFSTQDEPAFCGLASLAMVMNTLQIDPRRKWKGPWRWFHEEMLDCCKPLSAVIKEGITLDQASCIARCNGARTEMVRHSQISLLEFRSEVERCCSLPHEHLIVSYSRKAFLQTGDGHFSPLGGWHAASDHVLILDVARFKHSPHWVPLELLYKAMGAADPATGLCRGYLKMGSHLRPSSILFFLNLRCSVWQEAKEVLEGLPASWDETSSLEAEVAAMVGGAPVAAVLEVVGVRAKGLRCSPSNAVCMHEGAVLQLLDEMHALELFRLVKGHLKASPQGGTNPDDQPYQCERLCVFLLMGALERQRRGAEVPSLLKVDASSQIVLAEVEFLASQYDEMPTLLGADKQLGACCADGCAGSK